MPYEFTLPQLSTNTEEGIVVAWFKREGADVREGERLLEVQLAKVSYEVPSPLSGTLYRVLAPRDTVIRAGTLLALILRPGEEAQAAPAASETFVPATPAARRLARESGIDLSQITRSVAEGRVTEEDVRKFLAAREKPAEIRASPLARRLAQENGLDLAQLRGSGAGGRITEEDVRAALAVRAAAGRVKSVSLSPMRKTIARRMSESLQSMAQLTLTSEADVTELVEFRQSLKAQFDLTYTDLSVKATALTLKAHPYLNARLVGDELQLLEEIHIGVAVALDAGLIVPVIRNADAKALQAIAEETKALADRAREGKLTEHEQSGGTFTVTNLGTYGIDAFTPIINPPEAAVLGVGRIVDKPTRRNDVLLWRQLMMLSLTFDHRIVDGAPAAAFLQALIELLAHPSSLTASENHSS